MESSLVRYGFFCFEKFVALCFAFRASRACFQWFYFGKSLNPITRKITSWFFWLWQVEKCHTDANTKVFEMQDIVQSFIILLWKKTWNARKVQ